MTRISMFLGLWFVLAAFVGVVLLGINHFFPGCAGLCLLRHWLILAVLATTGVAAYMAEKIW